MSTAGGPARGVTQFLAASAARKQSLAGAVEHQHFVGRIDRARQVVAAAEPACDRDAELVEALVGRIAAELVDMRGDDRADERRDRMLRLADRQADRGLCPAGSGRSSSRSRTNGEREPVAREAFALICGGEVSPVIRYIITAGPPAAAPA